VVRELGVGYRSAGTLAHFADVCGGTPSATYDEGARERPERRRANTE